MDIPSDIYRVYNEYPDAARDRNKAKFFRIIEK